MIRSISRVLVFLFVFMLSTGMPQKQILATNRTYSISEYIINVVINKDGSADIEEKLTYDFNGQFNGALRDVDFSRTKGINDQSVYVIKNNDPIKWTQNSTSSIDYNGQPGTYNYVIDNELAHFKIFESSSNEKKTFVIKYKLLDVVTRYNDTAEFNRKIIDSNWQVTIKNVSINISLPDGASKDEIKIFAHGPLIGTSKIVDEKNVNFEISTLPSYTFLETLVLFPTRLVPDSSNVVSRDALEGIMASEKKLAEEANKVREEARQIVEKNEKAESRRRIIGLMITLLLLVLWIFIIVKIYLKYDKELKYSFAAKYYRELPGEYSPAEMSMLVYFGRIQPRDIMATLMDLVRRRRLTLEPGKFEKKGFFGSKEISTYVIARRKNAPYTILKRHESYLIDWFIDDIGNGESVDLEEIKEYVKNRTNARRFSVDYITWQKYVKEEADKNNFFDKTSEKGKLVGVLFGMLYFGLGIFVPMILLTPIAFIFTVLGVILLIFSARIKRRTAYGNEQNAMWGAFKNFLKDFSSMDKATLPSVIIWEHYLVYAISLGVAKEVIKHLPLVFDDNDLNNAGLTYMYGASYGYIAGFSTQFNDTIDTVESAINSAVSIANSSNSSSSGGGGGFSGGSSGGGGGGGGGGAF